MSRKMSIQRVAGRALWRSRAPQSGTWRVFSRDSEPFQLAREVLVVSVAVVLRASTARVHLS